MTKRRLLTIACVVSMLCPAINLFAATTTTRASVEDKIATLSAMVETARAKGLDVQREELAIHTAELFLDYADYDEENYDATKTACGYSAVYKNDAATVAAELPEFQRNESLLMIEDAIVTLQKVIDGDIIRAAAPTIDLQNLHLNGSRVVNVDNRPTYTSVFNFQPSSERYTKYYGTPDGYCMYLMWLQQDLTINAWYQSLLNASDDETYFGCTFLGHTGIAGWMSTLYPELSTGGRLFTDYDIDHPAVREYWDALLSIIVPPQVGQPRVDLGYMLANEPHWHTAAKAWDTPVASLASASDNWDTGEVSDYTIEKFKEWLEATHGDISRLNSLWSTSYASFDKVEMTVPVDNNLLGKAQWYDWMKFNQYRVTDWFTFLDSTIRTYDPSTYSNIKVMPDLFVNNKRDHGIDFEAICELQGVVGNDAAAWKRKAWSNNEEWENTYEFNWHEMVMGYDFFKSVAPDKVNYNSEAHYLEHTAFMYLDLSKEYTRCVYWLSTMMGCDAYNSWVWSRNEDFSVNLSQAGESHVGSVCTQPRVLNEVYQTMMDLNAHAYDIAAIQDIKQPIRIFYTETSALNKREHLDEMYELYEPLVFTGTPIGFATKNIIEKQDNNNWDVILVRNSPYVTTEELAALQSYLDKGGNIVMDYTSLLFNEYTEKHSTTLTASNGTLTKVTTLDAFVTKAFEYIDSSNTTPITIDETNSLDQNLCLWRAVDTGDGRIVLSLVNVGKVDTKITIKLDGQSSVATGRDLLTEEEVSGEMTVSPEQVVFIQLGNMSAVSTNETTIDTAISYAPSPFDDVLNVKGVKELVELYTINGEKIISQKATGTCQLSTAALQQGLYILSIDKTNNYKVVKK